MGKILSVIETAYRGTLEEQDDTSIWFTHILKNSGAEVSILLKSNAVNYAVKGQNAAGLEFGGNPVPRFPRIEQDLVKMIEQAVPVYLIQEDIQDRGIADAELISGIRVISNSKLAQLFGEFDKIWHW